MVNIFETLTARIAAILVITLLLLELEANSKVTIYREANLKVASSAAALPVVTSTKMLTFLSVKGTITKRCLWHFSFTSARPVFMF